MLFEFHGPHEGHSAGVLPVDTQVAPHLAAFVANAGHPPQDGDPQSAIVQFLLHGQITKNASGEVTHKPGGPQASGASSGGSGLGSPDPWSDPDPDMPVVPIYGPDDPSPPPWFPPPEYPDPGHDPIEGGGGGGEPDHGPHHHSPIPPRHPDKVNMDELRNLALSLSDKIMHRDKTIEISAAIIADADGHLRATNLKDGDKYDFKFDLDPKEMLPGDKVVAVIHSHIKGGVDAGYPSYTGNAQNEDQPDQAKINELIEKNPNGWFDPGMMQYILDIGSKTTYEFMGKGPDANRMAERADISHDIDPPIKK